MNVVMRRSLEEMIGRNIRVEKREGSLEMDSIKMAQLQEVRSRIVWFDKV